MYRTDAAQRSFRTRSAVASLAALVLLAAAVGSLRAVATPRLPQSEEDVRETIERFVERDPDLQEFFDGAAGYAVFPTVAKGALGIGAARGRGIVYEAGARTGTARLTQVTIGLQLGGQAYREVIFFEDQTSLDNFRKGNFELSAQASAVAVTLGAAATAGYERGVAIFTMTKGGLMYEASVGGQKFDYYPDGE